MHPPVVVTPPANVTVNVGQSASFDIGVDGALPFGYQWQRGGTNLTGATSKKLILPSVAESDAAAYRVIVSNPYGQTTSSVATLTVVGSPTITSAPASGTYVAGTRMNLTVTNTGGAVTYYWYQNVTNLLVDGTNLVNGLPNVIAGSSSNMLSISGMMKTTKGNIA